MVQVIEDQDLDGGAQMLTSLGGTDITRDRARPVGRTAPRGVVATNEDLCSKCGHSRAAIDTTD